MRQKFRLPDDCPKHSCGRCFFFRQLSDLGDGVCYIITERRHYAQPPCGDYECDINNY